MVVINLIVSALVKLLEAGQQWRSQPQRISQQHIFDGKTGRRDERSIDSMYRGIDCFGTGQRIEASKLLIG